MQLKHLRETDRSFFLKYFIKSYGREFNTTNKDKQATIALECFTNGGVIYGFKSDGLVTLNKHQREDKIMTYLRTLEGEGPTSNGLFNGDLLSLLANSGCSKVSIQRLTQYVDIDSFLNVSILTGYGENKEIRALHHSKHLDYAEKNFISCSDEMTKRILNGEFKMERNEVPKSYVTKLTNIFESISVEKRNNYRKIKKKLLPNILLFENHWELVDMIAFWGCLNPRTGILFNPRDLHVDR